MDIAGVIDEVGPDTDTDLSVGDAVMAMVIPSGSHGGYRESIVLAADAVARAPRGASHVEVATLPMNGLTARLSLDQLDLSPGETLAVTGAAGSYGGYVVQLAKADGLHVIADASEADASLVQGLGADVVVPRGDDIAERILHIPNRHRSAARGSSARARQPRPSQATMNGWEIVRLAPIGSGVSSTDAIAPGIMLGGATTWKRSKSPAAVSTTDPSHPRSRSRSGLLGDQLVHPDHRTPGHGTRQRGPWSLVEGTRVGGGSR